MAFYYLLLGHLLGDFVFQTDRIAENKGKHWQWNLLHVFVVTFCTGMLTYQFGILMLGMVVLNGALHYIIDYYKGSISKLLRLPDLAGFLFDQFIHGLLLYLISLNAVYGNYNIFVDFLSIRYLVVLVLITFFSAVFNQFVLAAVFPRADSKFFEEGEKHFGILTRVFISVVFYLSIFQSPLYLLLLLLLAGAISLMRRVSKWNKWMNPLQLTVKLILDTAIVTVGILIIVFM